ncbi:KOW motif-containing protein [Chloroflexota bacterium]
MDENDQVRIKNGKYEGKIGVITSLYSGRDYRNPDVQIVEKGYWVAELEEGRSILEPETNLEKVGD